MTVEPKRILLPLSLYEEMSTSELFMENESRFSEPTVHFQSMILAL